MSLSINNSPSMKLDTARDDVPSSTPPKSSVPLSTSKTDSAWASSALFPDNTRTTRGEMMISAGALSKLFDMLEQVFKSMREVLLGKNVTPQPAIPSDRALKATPDSSDPLKMKADAGTLPRTTSASADPQKVKVNADPLATTPSDTTGELKVKIDDGLLPGTSHKPASRVSPAVPVPSVNVSNDSNAQVKVELNIGHCHCPDTPVEHDRGRLKAVPGVQPNLVPMPKPEVTPQPEAKVPDTKAEVTPKPEAKVPGSHPGVLHKPEPVPLPRVVPQPDTKIVPPTDTKPTVTPDQPKPEPDVTSPGPAEKDNDLKGWSFINRRRLKT